jgi:hypothetical protein
VKKLVFKRWNEIWFRFDRLRGCLAITRIPLREASFGYEHHQYDGDWYSLMFGIFEITWITNPHTYLTEDEIKANIARHNLEQYRRGRLIEIGERLERPAAELEELEDECCAECGQPVLVENGREWTHGDMCFPCKNDAYDEDVSFLLCEVQRLEAEARRRA